MLLLDYIDNSSPSSLQLHPAQAGARRGYSTLSQVLVADELILRGKPVSVLLDLKGAFDSVGHLKLIETLRVRRTPEWIVSSIASLFTNQLTTCITVNGVMTEPIAINVGILQGSVLSPVLFEIFIDELCHRLNRCTDVSKELSALFYVDDIKLCCNDFHHAQELLDICEQWSIEAGMKFNVAKCFVISHSQCSNLSIYNQPLTITRSNSYLGVPTDENGSCWRDLLQTQLDMSSKLLRYCQAVGDSWPEWASLSIFKSFVESQLSYCAPAAWTWFKKQKKKNVKELLEGMKTFDEKALCWIFKLNKVTSANLLRIMSSIMSTADRLQYLTESSFLHFKTLHKDNPARQFDFEATPFRKGKSVLYTLNQPPDSYLQMSQCQPQEISRSTFKIFLKNLYLRQLQQGRTILQKYVINVDAGKPFKIDRVLFIEDPIVRRKAIQWRLNRLWLRYKCAVCDDHFNRAHISRCSYEWWTRSTWLSSDEQLLFRKHQQMLLEENEDFQGHYTVLDFLLNVQNFEKFAQLTHLIENEFLTR